MRFIDLVGLIFENLSRRKGRVALTAIGVVIGTAAVVVLVSLAFGLQHNATTQLGGIGDLTLIYINPKYEENPNVMVSRAGGGSMYGPPVQKVLNDEALAEIAAIPGVRQVVSRDFLQANGIIRYGKLETWAGIMGMGVKDLTVLDWKMKSGVPQLERGTAIFGEMMLQNFYDPRGRPGQGSPEPPDLQDKTVRLVLTKWTQDGIEVRKTVMVRVVGVIAKGNPETDWSILMPMEDVTAFNEWAMGIRINRRRDGYPMAFAKVDDMEGVLDITEQINNLGYQASTQQSFVQGINSFFVVLQVIFGGVGAMALLVAAIGIANTMTMSILERTREIGLMKAIGATNNNVLGVFLGEAAGIGFLGGVGGVVLGWGGGKVLNVLAVTYLATQAAQNGGAPPPSAAVLTPLWLPAFALGFAVLVGLLSGLYPALRAATLVPVNALKYE